MLLARCTASSLVLFTLVLGIALPGFAQPWDEFDPDCPFVTIEVPGPNEEYVSTDSGLEYIEARAGDGPIPDEGQDVYVHYTGYLAASCVRFDSSLERNQPLAFTLGERQVIPGFEEGIASMPLGSQRRLIIPAELGYGGTGNGPIPPHATLVFDVELVRIAEGGSWRAR
jgi:peptidylprolyl isomerase